jgi:delta 1-pyrroline-5-carboxylate dehydrogenase
MNLLRFFSAYATRMRSTVYAQFNRRSAFFANVLYNGAGEYSVMCGQALVEIFHKAGVPDDVLILVVGDGSTGKAMCEPEVSRLLGSLVFIGSPKTGAAIQATLATAGVGDAKSNTFLQVS